MSIMDFLFFRRMLFPLLVQLIFWLTMIICLFFGIYNLCHQNIKLGFTLLIFGPLLVRISCEYLIVLFRINDTLTDINNRLSKKPFELI